MVEMWLAYHWARWSYFFWPYGLALSFVALGLLFSPRRAVRRSAGAVAIIGALTLAIQGWQFVASAARLMHARAQALAQLEGACVGAGEQVERTVDNVAGLYVGGATPDGRRTTLHEHDRNAETWISPLRGPLYQFVELVPWGKSEVARTSARYELETVPGRGRPRARARISTSSEWLPEPSAAYAIEWEERVLWTATPHRVMQDVTRVVDRASGRAIATRRIAWLTDPYPVLDHGTWRWGGSHAPVTYCDGYAPAHDPGWRDGNPRTSVEFVARVLRPRPLPPDFNAAKYDLAPGSGYRKPDHCRGIQVGQGVRGEDLKIKRLPDRQGTDAAWDEVEFRIAGSDDVLVCEGLFRQSGRRELALYFADGPIWRWPEVKARMIDFRKK